MNRATDLGLIRLLFPAETACALACPIALGFRGHGAIVFHGDRHDLLPEFHGPLLNNVTNLTADILTCRFHSGSDSVASQRE